MFDIKWIRDNPEEFDRGMTRRGLEPQSAALIALDATRRETETLAQEIQAERNKLSKEVGELKAKGEDAVDLIAKVSRTKAAEAEAGKAADEASAALDEAMAQLPNLPAADVPDGTDEAANEEIRVWGDKPKFDFTPKEHFDIGEALGLMDFETAARMSGARFVLLSGALAHMERALANFMLDLHTTEHGLTEVNPPALVNDDALFGTGQLPKFGDDLFTIDQGSLWLIPTAEVPLTNIAAGRIVEADDLPRRYAAMTWCFRSEAGAAGKDTRGMIRL
ncbi:MAG: serine--tRNA ligase, partial [Proteobacteria bacterium]|nr:serine--tRNA ligase [Pseudomonadota bacterium]